MSGELDALYEEAQSTRWFHSIDLGDGRWTQGQKTPEQMRAEVERWAIPDDLTGKSVLDVGCADGGWTVAALRRGAATVVSIDEQQTEGMRFLRRSGLFAIDFRLVDLYSRTFSDLPVFDVVIFCGVLYHVENMLDALKRVRLKARELVILETHVNERFGGDVPYAVYYEHDEHNGDHTNWWGPNRPCLEGMLRTAGFAPVLKNIGRESAENSRVCYHLTPRAERLPLIREIGGRGLRGYVDEITPDAVRGWAWDADAPEARVEVVVLVDGREVARGPADGLRPDLRDLAFGDGRHGFDLRARIDGAFRGDVRIVFAETGRPLPGAEQPIPEGERLTRPSGMPSGQPISTIVAD